MPYGARNRKKRGPREQELLHLTTTRHTDTTGLPDYTIARDELRQAFSALYTLLIGDKRETFRKGLDDDWDVSTIVLSQPE